jgi:DNA-directed RNA polymerase II subunit RPB1
MAIENTSAAGSRLMDMIKSGSRANKNVTQMAGCLATDRRRSSPPLSYDGRTLPHFERYDNRPEARGFIESSFLKGLDPHEFFSTPWLAGRTDRYTAVKTQGTYPSSFWKTEFAST